MNLFPSEELVSLISDKNNFEVGHLLVKGFAPFSEPLLRYCASGIFQGIERPEQDIKLLKSGSVSYPTATSCINGELDYYYIALLLARGKTIVFNHLEKRMICFNEIYNLLIKKCSLLSHYNIYWSPADSSGAGMHADDHDVIIIQLEGKKIWRFEDGDIMLSAGDVLFIQKGVLHNPVTEKNHQSIHLTIGVVEGKTSFPFFEKPPEKKIEETLQDFNFILSMGSLLSGKVFSVMPKEDVIIKEDDVNITFTYKKSFILLKKEVFCYLFDGSIRKGFKVRDGIEINDAINVILTFYKMKIPIKVVWG
ncbi:JmjC domain-containing protein [Kosakonia cowanii]|uniref:JmjC domain-containing protein n=1 Tax=Kosakonia cowanii TaxID=208223 RepID=UPI0028A16000|nr:cupin domain-containing protein [Kosakonia cowanii]